MPEQLVQRFLPPLSELQSMRMIKGGLKYYILFENYEQGLALHDVLDSDDIPNRIARLPEPFRVNYPAV